MGDIEKFEGKVAEQLALLADACAAFDAGKIYQMKSISTRLYVVCNDLARDKGWRYWGQEGGVPILTTAIPPHPGNLITSHHPLASIRIGSSGASFSPHGSKPPPNKVRFIKHSKWWKEMVLRSDEERKLTRKDIVLQMRNYDGGSHGFEKEPTEDYAHMLENRGVGWIAGDEKGQADFELSALEATTRQVAHELLYSLVPKLTSKDRSLIEYDLMWSPIEGGQPSVPPPVFRR